MADVKRRRIDTVLVWKLDRFGRSLKHLVSSLAEFEAVGVAFVSLRDSFDLTTPAGRLMFNMVASFAEFEGRTPMTNGRGKSSDQYPLRRYRTRLR